MGEPYWSDEGVTLYLGKCEDVLRDLPDNSVDSIVTDPPYGLEFMGAEWDTFRTGDGFRRSRNEADAGRDSVFGRTSRTAPEYSTGRLGKQPKIGEADGSKFRQNMGTPSYTGSGNPTCRNCGGDKYRNGERKCRCEAPDFGNPSAVQMNAFQAWCERWAGECLRVLKPGGWMLAFGGTRTWHRLTCGIEDAGFDIHDGIADLLGQDAPGMMWVYGSGFPKSRDAARSVDMEVCTLPGRHCMRKLPDNPKPGDHVCPESEEGKPWQGWGTAAKPAWEPVVVARKPLAGTLGWNLLEHGTGALNIDGGRVEGPAGSGHWIRNGEMGTRGIYGQGGHAGEDFGNENPAAGRWVPNVLITHAADCRPAGTRKVRNRSGSISPDVPSSPVDAVYGDRERVGWQAHGDVDGMETVQAWECTPGCPAAELDRQSGATVSRRGNPRKSAEPGAGWGMTFTGTEYEDSGGASRFFPAFRYQAKAPASERPMLPDGTKWPTVKPLPLVCYLVCLVTPPGGTVLDLFIGSGTTGEACMIEGFPCILIDKDPVAAELTKTRLRKSIQPVMFRPEAAPAAPVRPVAASRPKPAPVVHPSLFDELEAS